jgi:3-methyladenine DNA glycosylase AlkC
MPKTIIKSAKPISSIPILKTPRKGAKNRASVLPNLLQDVNSGIEQTASLSEALAINLIDLLSSVYPQYKKEIAQDLQGISELGILKKMQNSAEWIIKKFGTEKVETSSPSLSLKSQVEILSNHTSDTIRGISCYLITYLYTDIQISLKHIYNLANDHHFSVREWAWLALRNQLIKQFHLALPILYAYSIDKNENIRRFSSEISRPRGVWCAHVNILKHNIDDSLELCKPILNNLQADSSRYVQNSVGNWLNDCAKSQKDWVMDLCNSWDNTIPETSYIIKRGHRNI